MYVFFQVKARWRPPTKDIFKPFLEAIETFEMIKPGDRVLVCLSGGKDSLTLLHTMKQYQYYTKMAFDLGAMTIDPLSSAYDPRPLIPYLKELNVPYLYEEQVNVFCLHFFYYKLTDDQGPFYSVQYSISLINLENRYYIVIVHILGHNESSQRS